MRRAVPAFVITCSIALAAACPARAAEYRTLFQDPGPGISQDLSLENHAIALIDATPAGEHITIALRDFNRQPVADALIAAHLRGVQVDGVIDGGERTRAPVQQLRAVLGPTRFVICGEPAFQLNSCIASGPAPSLQHNKFLTFSGLADGRRNVVLQTSKNFFGPSQLTYYNDMVEIAGDEALYRAYVKYLLDMKAQARSNTYYFPASGDDGRTTIFPSPRPQPDLDTDDTIVDRMNEIDCSDGGTIRAANMAFRRERAVIMRKLIELRREGCDVELIVSNLDGSILAGLVSAGVTVHPFFQRAVAPRQQVIVHSKFWLVDARSRLTGERTRITYAGSSNWRGDQQYSDDLLLRIVDDGVHAAYSAYWELIAGRAVSDQNRPANDAVAPASALTASPAPNVAGWNRSPVTLRVAASDGHNVSPDNSGLKRLHVDLSGAQTGASDFAGETAGYNVQELPVTAEGETTVTYFSEDVKGNLEPARTHVVRLDAAPPAIAGLPRHCRIWPPNKRMVHVADVIAVDAGSGLAHLAVTAHSNARRDAGDIVIDGGSVYLRAEKADRGRTRRYVIEATALDVAGNAQSATATCRVKQPRRRLR
jgi:phosphatidylserine/phosphatidylglycerophosphate/cardiolipin synthase-like enzyme